MSFLKSDLRTKKNSIRMSHNIFKKILVILAILSIFLGIMGNYNNSFARSRKKKIDISTIDTGYTIKKLKIDAKVTETNDIQITEEMDVFFNYEKHGIYRVIPEKNTIIEDGDKKKVDARVSNVTVNENFTSTSQDGYKILKIGDKDKTIVGDKKYIIKYTYSIEKYNTKDGIDEFYFNIVGDKINTTIGSVEYKIEFPKKYNKENIYLYAGRYEYKLDGEETVNEEKGIVTDVLSDTVIAGRIDKLILPFKAVTLRIKLGKDYFILRNNYTDILAKIGTAVAVMTFIYTLIILYKYGRDKKLSDIITFKLPKELDVSNTYYLKYKTTTDYRKIVPALIIEFANEGYIEIGDGADRQEKGIFAKKPKDRFDIVKIKDYNGNQYRKKIFDALFSKGDVLTEKNIKKVGQNIVTAVTEGVEIMQNSKFDKEVYDQSGLKHVWKILGMTIIPLIILFLGAVSFVGSVGLTFKIISTIAILVSIFMSVMCLKKASRITTVVGVVVQLLIIIIMLVYSGVEAKFISGLGTGIYYIVSAILLSLQVLISFWMEKKTQKGMMYEAQVNGFVKYIKTAREEELKEHPKMFFDILPYTYIFGISKLWINKFSNIEIEKPEWYTGNVYSAMAFGQITTHVTEKIQVAMSDVASSVASSASSSGGGVSGGGFRRPEE
ncbi:MAG: DUF2207 domain-containing protein [Clostridiales bacterium]|nr:DUF2207 domain-containing protein [Clostridiales bacterium]